MCVVNFVEESDSRWKESPAESLCPTSWVMQPAAEGAAQFSQSLLHWVGDAVQQG